MTGNVQAAVVFAAVLACTLAWPTPNDDPASRAQKLLKQMNLTEKLALLHGYKGDYVGNVPANTRLGIPALKLNDGPQGFRGPAGTSTCWPSTLTIAASFDQNNSMAWGQAMGKEFFDKGANVQLGPGVCLARIPQNGRNFEYIAGEDPILGYKMVGPLVQGIQSQHVVANAKHYINNNQETNRGAVSENVDERTEFELYLPTFEGAVKAGVGSIMCSYNKINDTYSCENNRTLNTYLKQDLGFQGWVMSDWGATHSTSINQGLDQEMPSDDWMGSKLADAVNSGQVSMDTIDNSVLRILTPLYAVGVFDNPTTGNPNVDTTSDANNRLARELSAKSHVLLKNNNNVLPLNVKQNIVIIGSAAADGAIVHGGGSGQVFPKYVITPYEGIVERVGGNVTVNCSYVPNVDYYQPGNPSAPATSKEQCCKLCGLRPDCNYFGFVASDNTCWFKSTDDGKRDDPNVVSGSCTSSHPLPYYNGSDPDAAADAAAKADVAIVVVATSSHEGSDRANLSLPNGNDELISKVAAKQKNTIVVMSVPGATLTPWRDEVAAIVVNFMPGQEAGHALADVLFGDVNPAARLPLTFPVNENDQGFTPQQYPGVPDNKEATYSERYFVGYRWYDQHNVDPAFPFGHGLSYTSFKYSDLSIDGRKVSFTVANTGSRDGAEVAQLYLGFPKSADEPPKLLKNFQKVDIKAGGSQKITFTVSDRDVSIWDVSSHSWQQVKGTFQVMVGASSRDIRLSGTMSN